MFVENIDEGDVKRRNSSTFQKQVDFFQTWCARLGIQDPTLHSLPQAHRERVILAYAIEVSQGHNLKSISNLSPKSVSNYLRAAANFALENGHQDPRYRFAPSGLPLDGANYFPSLKKLMSHMKKWCKGRDEALPITSSVLNTLLKMTNSSSSDSLTQCVFDAVCLGIQTGSRCSEYCSGSPTNPSDDFCRVPSTHYSGKYAGYPIAFTTSDFQFLTDTMNIVPHSSALADAVYLRVRFRFDKGGTGNIQFRTFRRFPPERSDFCPLRAVLCAFRRWEQFQLDPLTPVFCYAANGIPTFLHDSSVTTILRRATQATYPEGNNLFNIRLKDVRTHSLRVTACLILVVAKLPTPAIEHRLRWASTAWKVYVRESLSHIHDACASAFFTALEDGSSPSSSPSQSQQAFDVDDFL